MIVIHLALGSEIAFCFFLICGFGKRTLAFSRNDSHKMINVIVPKIGIIL